MKRINVGIIGTGKFAGHHATVWNSLKEVVLLGVHGTDLSRMHLFSERYTCKIFEDIDELISECDLIDIVSANNTHATYALKAINSGCHVIIEKPIDINLEQARAICAAVKRKQVVASVVANYRFNSNFKRLKQLLENNELGDIIGGRVTVSWPRNDSYYKANDGWRSNPDKVGGGVLMHQCIHHIDLLHWLFGEIDRVSGVSDHWTGELPGMGVEQTFAGLLTFKSGVSVDLFFTTASAANAGEYIELFGTKSNLYIDNHSYVISSTSRVRMLIKTLTSTIINVIKIRLGLKLETTSALLSRQFTEIVKAITENEAISVSVTDGLIALEIVNALYYADQDKRTVKFSSSI